MTSETQALTAVVAKIIETRRDQVRINPSWIATEALLEIDPKKVSVPLVYLGCHLELRKSPAVFCANISKKKHSQRLMSSRRNTSSSPTSREDTPRSGQRTRSSQNIYCSRR